DLGLFIKQALLLIEGEQVAQKEQIGFGLVGLILQVEDTKVLAVAILIKVAVGVVKDDGLAVFSGERIVARRRESLPKGSTVFKGETCFAKRIAVLAPGFAARTFVPFVHKDQIATVESLYRHANATPALFFYQVGDFDDLHGVFTAAPQAAVIEVEALGRDARSFHFGQVLLTQALVGRYQQDVIKQLLVVVQELIVVKMQNQRLAATRSHPVSQLGQVGFSEGLVLRLAGQFLCVALAHKGVQVGQELRFVVEQAVEDDFRVERCQVLKIAEGDGPGAAGVNDCQVRANVVVIACKVIGRNFELAAARDKAVVNMAASLRIKTFLSLFHVLQQFTVFLVTQQAVEPGKQEQAIFKFLVLG